MPVIKRYANRKLYDTANNCYVNLDAIAEMIRAGEDVQVIDNVSGEDLTTLTLTQIIMEKEKKEGEYLPKSILSALIEAGGESLTTIRHKLSSPLDLIHQVDAEISQRIETLIQRGEIGQESGAKLRAQLLETGQKLGIGNWISDQDLIASLTRLGIPTRSEFESLNSLIDELSQKLDEALTKQ